jgi:N-acetylglucosamine-6-phosphate deacetylase
VRLGVSAALVDGGLLEGDVAIEDGRLAAVGLSPGGSGLAAPGFVDLHINGIAGVDFLTADEDAYARAAERLAAAGVVAFQPTFVSSPRDAYAEALAAAAAAQARLADAGLPRLLGVHLEGPFLEPRWAGAHDPSRLTAPDPALAAELCAAGPVTMMTLAPELPGALELIEQLVGSGVVVSCGHSDADAPAAHAAFERGARAVTHIHNAHRRWQARDPGLAGVALARPDVLVQAIVDGVHLAPESAQATFLAAAERFCLVTDSVQAAAMGPGEYALGDVVVHVEDGAARLADGTLAGSLVTMDQAVRNLVAGGAALVDALRAAAGAPARALGRPELGEITPGAPANLVVLDDQLEVRRTLVEGTEAFAAG